MSTTRKYLFAAFAFLLPATAFVAAPASAATIHHRISQHHHAVHHVSAHHVTHSKKLHHVAS